MKRIVLNHKNGHYNINIGHNLYADIGAHIAQFNPANNFCPIISDSKIPQHYIEQVQQSLQRHNIASVVHIVPSGEQAKSYYHYAQVADALLQHNLERNSQIIALGGGVVGDLTGFLASSLLRGINFHQIPTTLLAQIDSSVGGKTGINSIYGKNLIGAFHQPLSVVINLDVLHTLSAKHWRAGFGELLKYALIDGEDFIGYIERNLSAIKSRDSAIMAEIIARSCQKKADIVAQDEHEHGVRALLNLGHTFAHALERLYDYKYLAHGELVGFGLLLAFRFAQFLCYNTGYHYNRDIARIEHINKTMKLATSFRDLPCKRGYAYNDMFNANKLVDHMRNDKKNTNQHITFILPKYLGNIVIEKHIRTEQIITFLEQQIHG